MDDVEHLRQSIERLYDCRASHEKAVPIKETFQGQKVWEGVVHANSLTSHPTAKRAYAWSSPIEELEKRKVYAVLELPPVQGAADAVRAAIVAEHKSGGRDA